MCYLLRDDKVLVAQPCLGICYYYLLLLYNSSASEVMTLRRYRIGLLHCITLQNKFVKRQIQKCHTAKYNVHLECSLHYITAIRNCMY